MKSYKLRKGLTPYFKELCKKRNIHYTELDIDDEKYNFFEVDVNGKTFHRLLIRCTMLELTDLDNSTVPYISKKEKNDEQVRLEVGTNFIIRDKMLPR